MRWPIEIALAIRYMLSRRRDAFVSLITIISISGIALGVAALIVVLSVMNGFQHDLVNKILGTNAHVVVLRSGGAMVAYNALSQEILENFGDDVVGVTPFIYNQGMLTSQANVLGAVVRGIDPATVTEVTEVGNHVAKGSLDDLYSPTEVTSGELPTPGIGLGIELATNLGVSIGDNVNLVSPTGEITPFGSAPRFREFEVKVLFSTGMYEYDSGLAYIDIKQAQEFYGMTGSVTGLELKLVDPQTSDTMVGRIIGRFGFPYYARDWKEMNRNLFGALKLEKLAMSIILVLIVLVAAFNIVSTLFMVVLEKARDIAILKSMGGSNLMVSRIFRIQGLVIGIVGSFFGLIIGLCLTLVVDRYDLIKLPKDIYYIDKLPIRVDPMEITMIIVGALVISWLATLYPAKRATRIEPIQGIRYGAE